MIGSAPLIVGRKAPGGAVAQLLSRVTHAKRRFIMSVYQGFIMTAAEAREFDREAAK